MSNRPNSNVTKSKKIYRQMKRHLGHSSRGKVMAKLVQKLGISEKCASTYYANCRNEFGDGAHVPTGKE